MSQDLVAALPRPPTYFKMAKSLIPPPIPQSNEYKSFGYLYQKDLKLIDLSEAGCTSLLEKSEYGMVEKFRELWLELSRELDLLIKNVDCVETERISKIDRIHILLLNLSNFLNNYRWIQSVHNMKSMLKNQSMRKRDLLQIMKQAIEKTKNTLGSL